MVKPPSSASARRTVSRYLRSNAQKDLPNSAVAENEASSPQRPCRSRSRRQGAAPSVETVSPWQVPWKPSPVASRGRKAAKHSKDSTGLFGLLPEEVPSAPPQVGSEYAS